MSKSYDFAETLTGECKCIGIVLQSATFGRAPPSGQPVWTILYQNEGDPTLLRKHVHPPIGVDPFSRACVWFILSAVDPKR